MPQQKVIRTTLGELIVALTDQVRPFVHDPSDLCMATSWVLNDLLARHQLHVAQQSRRIYSSCFPQYCGHFLEPELP
jgi:hypothetical protein